MDFAAVQYLGSDEVRVVFTRPLAGQEMLQVEVLSGTRTAEHNGWRDHFMGPAIARGFLLISGGHLFPGPTNMSVKRSYNRAADHGERAQR